MRIGNVRVERYAGTPRDKKDAGVDGGRGRETVGRGTQGARSEGRGARGWRASRVSVRGGMDGSRHPSGATTARAAGGRNADADTFAPSKSREKSVRGRGEGALTSSSSS